MGASVDTAVRAVLFTDVVGSTPLRSRLGDVRADELRRIHDEMLGTAVTTNRGQVLRWTGDGLKAVFVTASAAVSCAIDMQRAVRRYGRQHDAIAPFEIRIGISVGETTLEDGDHHGLAVVEAARLEALAAPGEILAGDLVQRLGQRRSDARFEEVGSRRLDGLDDPVPVVRVIDPIAVTGTQPIPKALPLDRRFPLVGRGEVFGQLLRSWRDAAGGVSSTALVSGPPGVGKSRLISQLADRVHAEGAVVLAGICDRERAVPYQPFTMALADVSERDDVLAAAIDRGEGHLARLFSTGAVQRIDEQRAAERHEVFMAVAELLARLAGDQPVLLVLEDLQWASASTVELLRHLVRTFEETPLLVVGSYRSDEVDHAHPLRELLVETHSSSRMSTVTPGVLDETHIGEMISARAPAAPDQHVASFARRVRVESAGSPFFVCELLHHLAETGELQRLVVTGAGDQLPIPDSVRDVVDQRLALLGADAVELITSAAVVGLSFDIDLLASLLGVSEEATLAMVEDLSAVAIVQEVDIGRFAFAHAIVRTTLLDRLSATRRALAHRRVAESLGASGRADPEELAHHWLAAGDEVAGHRHLEDAAARDMEALAYESAADRYDLVLEYRQRTEPDGSMALGHALLGVALARRALVDAGYLQTLAEAGRIGRAVGDADLLADVALASVWPSSMFQAAGLIDPEFVGLCDVALERLGPDDPRRASVLATQAVHLCFDDDPCRRQEMVDEAAAIARAVNDDGLLATVLTAESVAMWNPATCDRRIEVAESLGRLGRNAGDVDVQCWAGFVGAIGSVECGDLAGARHQLLAIDDLVEASRNDYFGFLVARLRVSIDLIMCRPGVQQSIDDLSSDYVDSIADIEGTWAVQTGGVAMQEGRLGEMAPAMGAMIEGSTIASNWTAAYGLALLMADDRHGAQSVLDRLTPPTFDYFWMATTQTTAQLAVGLDALDVCARLFDDLLPYRSQLGVTGMGALCFGLVGTSLGELALALDRFDIAIELLQEAGAHADAIGAPFDGARSRRLLAQTVISSGATAVDVHGIVEEALALAERHGFAREWSELRRLIGDQPRGS